MRSQYFPLVLVAITAGIGIANQTNAGEGCCAHCGCAANCQKVCRLVREDRKVEATCWGCKCEDFCVPGPSKPGCRHSELICSSCDEPGDGTVPQAKPKSFVWTEWMPGGAKIFARKKLMKKCVTIKVHSYKWVIEDLCVPCQATCPPADIQPGANVPPPPVTDAKRIP